MFLSRISKIVWGGRFLGMQYLNDLRRADVLGFCDTIEVLLVKAEDRTSFKNNKS